MNIFIDTEDMEERYGKELYKEYLEKQNKELQKRIDKAIDLLFNEYESCKGALTNPEYTIVSTHQLLKNEINTYKKAIEILKGGKE